MGFVVWQDNSNKLRAYLRRQSISPTKDVVVAANLAAIRLEYWSV